jgi:hypothetical protein
MWHGKEDGAKDCAYKWNTFSGKDISIGYFFNLCRDYGIMLK